MSDGNKSRFLRIIERAADRRTQDRRHLIAAVILVLLLAGMTYYVKGREKQLEALEARIQAAMANIVSMEQTRVWAQRLPIEGMRIANVNGELSITGKIKNELAFEVGDIGLTAYLMASDGLTVLYEQTFTVSSTDGLPLSNGQRRPFRLKLDQVPGSADNVILIVTRVEKG